MSTKLNAILKCPFCHKEQKLKMPTDSCQFFYKCKFCSKILKPKKGDCCVFCSFANVKCPSKQ